MRWQRPRASFWESGSQRIYLALDLKHQRPVAIKVLDPELAAAIGAERFLREIEVVGRLNHPHILPLHDSASADGSRYFTTRVDADPDVDSRTAGVPVAGVPGG